MLSFDQNGLSVAMSRQPSLDNQHEQVIVLYLILGGCRISKFALVIPGYSYRGNMTRDNGWRIPDAEAGPPITIQALCSCVVQGSSVPRHRDLGLSYQGLCN